MFGRILRCYTTYIFSGPLAPDRILPGSKFTLRLSLAFSYIGTVTAWHSSSGRQSNFAALNRGRHLYSAGRPSGWALAHISSCLVIFGFRSSFFSKTEGKLNRTDVTTVPLYHICLCVGAESVILVVVLPRQRRGGLRVKPLIQVACLYQH